MKNEQRTVSFFLILMTIFPIVDVLNGYVLSMHYSLPVGVIYRMICFLFLVIAILLYGFRQNLYTMLTFSTIFVCGILLLIQSIVLSHTPEMIFQDSVVLIKFYLWLLIPYFVYQHQQILRTVNYDKIFVIISFLFTIGLLIPYFLNVGNQTYENSAAGYKGFYFATNDTTLAFIVASTFTGWYLVKKVGNKSGIKVFGLLALYFGNMLCLLLLATKTGILYGIILTASLFIYFVFFQNKIPTVYRVMISAVAFIFIIFIFFNGRQFIVEATVGTINRITYFYKLFDGDLVRLITSSRSDYLQGGWNYFIQSNHLFLIPLIGFGFEYRLLHFGRIGLIEMDFFDLLFSFGLIGLVIVTIMIIYFATLSLKKQSRTIYSITYLVLLIYGFMAGHVFFSALSTTLLGLVCGGIILKQGEDCK